MEIEVIERLYRDSQHGRVQGEGRRKRPPPYFGQAKPIFLNFRPQTAMPSDLAPPSKLAPPPHSKFLDPPLDSNIELHGCTGSLV